MSVCCYAGATGGERSGVVAPDGGFGDASERGQLQRAAERVRGLRPGGTSTRYLPLHEGPRCTFILSPLQKPLCS